MDPNNLPQPQFDLPSPQHHQELGGVNPNAVGQEAPRADELRNTEYQGIAGTSPPPATQPGKTGLLTPTLGIPHSNTTATLQAVPTPVSDNTLMAEDSDLIEKEWVQKAKAIVDQTRNDPYIQNREISKVKATYIKKRYNKDIKVNNE
jgi:hypothetical protein